MLEHDPQRIDPSRGSSLFLRLTWMWMLPSTVLCILLVAVQPAWTFGPRDLALVLIVAVGIAARLGDVLWFSGTTAEGDPATLADVKRYAASLVLLAVLGWLAAQVVPL